MKEKETAPVDAHPVDGADGTEQAPSIGRRFLSLPTLVAFVLAISLLVFLLLRFDVDLGETGRSLVHGRWPFFLVAFLLYYFSFLVRGLRWYLIIENAGVGVGKGKGPRPWDCSLYIFLSWFANSVSWFRLGDAYRAYLLNEVHGASFSRGLGTVLAERIIDVAVVFAMLALGALGLVLGGETLSGSVILAAFALVVAVVLALAVMWRFGLRLALRLPHRLQGVYHRFHAGTIGSFRRLPVLFVLGVAGWLLEAARFYFVAQALELSISLPLVLFVSMAHALLTTLPITPGGLGLVEPGMVGLLALQLPRSAAIPLALLDRSITYASVVIFGGFAFALRQGIRAWRGRGLARAGLAPTRQAGYNEQEGPRFKGQA